MTGQDCLSDRREKDISNDTGNTAEDDPVFRDFRDDHTCPIVSALLTRTYVRFYKGPCHAGHHVCRLVGYAI